MLARMVIRNVLTGKSIFQCKSIQQLKNGRRKFCFQPMQGEVTTETIEDVKIKIMERLGLDVNFSPIMQTREHLLKYEPKPESLPPRTMQDSLTSAIIPLGTMPEYRDKYVTYLGRIRLGRLLEDMDFFAVWVCHKHVLIKDLEPSKETPLPYTFVTILADKVEFSKFIPTYDHDVRLSGHVSWVGNSSIEVVMWLEQMHVGQMRQITRAVFLIAARNATNTKAAPVNKITPGNDYEKKILAGGEDRKNRRIMLQNQSIWKAGPTAHEFHLIHTLFSETIKDNQFSLNERVLPANARWMEETGISNTIFSQPEHRNAQNTVFGGFLMRMALEMSWVCAFTFAKKKPKVERICDILFQKPIDVSSLIQMTAYVTYTEAHYMEVTTVAEIFNPITGEKQTSNVFYFTLSNTEILPRVVPNTYHEALWYLEGRRKLHYSLGVK